MSERLSSRDATFFFVIAHILAGGLHYLFQVWSATQLNLSEFGELTSWVAYYSIALSLGSFAQFGANFFIVGRRGLEVLSWTTLLFTLFMFVCPWLVPQASGWLVGCVGVFLGVVFSWFMGQAQARLAFVVMGLGMLICGLAKFVLVGWGLPVQDPSLKFAWVISLSYGPGLLWLSLALGLQAKKWTPHKKNESEMANKRTDMMATALLALTSVLVPQMDMIVVHQTQIPELIGSFARISLLYKAVFFSFLIFAQWLLPHQLSASQEAQKVMDWLGGGKGQRRRAFGISLGLGFIAYIFSLALGWLWRPGLLEHHLWIAQSCLNMALLTNIYYMVQLSCVERKLLLSFKVLLWLLIELFCGILGAWSITQYLGFAIVFNFAIWLSLSLNFPFKRFQKL